MPRGRKANPETRKRQIGVSITEATRLRLEEEAIREGVKPVVLARKAIEKFLKARALAARLTANR